MQHIPAVPDSIESVVSLIAKQTPNSFRSLELQRANLLRARADAERIRKTSAQIRLSTSRQRRTSRP